MVRLAFAGDDTLIVTDGIVRIVDVGTVRDGAPVEMPARELGAFEGETVLDVAGLDGEVWAAVREDRSSRTWLVRRRLDGTPLAERLALPSAAGQLITSPQARSVVWNSDPSLLVMADGEAPPLTLEPG